MVVRKKFWVVMAAGMMLLALVATTGVGARAAGSAPLAGTWEVGDHSQGGWAGGNLLPGGSLNGGGQISFHTPDGQQQVAQIDVKHSTWAFTDATDTTVNFCFTLIGKQGSVFPIGQPIQDCSISVPVGTGVPVQVGGAGDPDLYGKVTLVPASQH